MTTYQDFFIPPEISSPPIALIALAGLDIQRNSTHKLVWETFSGNRAADRVPLRFICIWWDHKFPSPKAKRVSYESYAPGGIFKRNWIEKHCKILPAVAVLFYDLDLDDGKFAEKVGECANRVKHLKISLDGRNTKIAMVLLQRSTPFVTNDDPILTERASALCIACDINPKALLLLHFNDHLQGYVVRLESAFYEFAQSYYQHAIRGIKLHKDAPGKGNHQYLSVRHAFKMAVFNEMKQDYAAAQKNYAQAYASLLELRTNDVNLYEVKIAAAFLTYKTCKLSFSSQSGQPVKDAANYFAVHAERFKLKIGPKELAFEHYDWLSKQFAAFGDLFEEGVRRGDLPAVQMRHPGFYYEQAAYYAVKRKELVAELCADVFTYPENDPLTGWDKLEYYGQRPWRPGKLANDPIDAIMEERAVLALQYREKFSVNHSAIIIGYLGNAAAQFKSYRSPRKRTYLIVQMADEYYTSGDYTKALTLMAHALWEYRKDMWWSLALDLSKKALKCAYLTRSWSEYCESAFECVCLHPDPAEKVRFMGNIRALLQKEIPKPEPDLETEEPLAIDFPTKLIVDMNSVTSFMHVKAKFAECDSDFISVILYLRSEFPENVTFSQLAFSISSGVRNAEFVVAEHLDFPPFHIGKFEHRFPPCAAEIGKEIQLNCVTLTMGNESASQRLICLKFNGKWSEGENASRDFSNFKITSKENHEFAKFIPKTTICVKPKESKVCLCLQHRSPHLISEWCSVTVQIKNTDAVPVKNCSLQVSLYGSDASNYQNFTDFSVTPNGPLFVSPYTATIPSLRAGEMTECSFLMMARSGGTRQLKVKLAHTSTSAAGECVDCTAEMVGKIECAAAFEATAAFFSRKCREISKIYVGEGVLMTMQIDCVSPWPVLIVDTQFSLAKEIGECEKFESCLKNCVLKCGETGREMVSFCVDEAYKNQSISLGTFSISCRRDGGGGEDGDSFTMVTSVQLPQITAEYLPVSVETDLRVPGWVRSPMPLSILVRNKSSELMSLDANMEHKEVDAFMFSGNKKMSFTILPQGFHAIRYNLFPLVSGVVALPSIKLTLHSEQVSAADFSDLLKRTLPSRVFIMPKKEEVAS